MSDERSAASVDILVVDDHPENRAALRAILSSPEYRVVEAASGPEALKHLLHRQFAVLLLDVVMPEMSGFELAAAIKQRRRTATVPILFLTAEADDLEQIYAAYELGAVDYLVKPLVPQMVRAKVAVFAELYRQRVRVEEQAALLLATARKETELEIFELRLANERRFRSLADAIPHMIFAARPDGTVDYFNRRWFEYTGISAEEAGGSWDGAVHPDDRERVAAAWGAAIARGELTEFECRLRSAADCSYRWHLCRALPERGPSGVLDEWFGTFTDVDEQRRERVVLAEFKGTLDAVQDTILIFDPASWRILYASQGACAMLGYSADELLNMKPLELMPEFDTERFRPLLSPSAGVGAARWETRYHRRDGGDVPIEVALQRIEINGGRIVSIGRDISDRRRAESERQRLYDKAVEAVRLRDHFLSIASHELRTPLTALRLSIEGLVRLARQDVGNAAAEERASRKLQQAMRQVDRLTTLVDDLLDVSRMTAGRLRIEPEDVDLVALVREVTSRFEDETRQAGCRVTIDAEGELRGRWDPVRIEQIVVNLLSNALKFGAGKPIEIAIRGDPASAHLTVRDHGIGISPEARERIFRRFERAVTDSHFRGLGLGLYIVDRIVAAHGGTVSVASEPGQGATFTVVLPREASATPVEAEAEREEPEVGGER